jgi:hypothetical protein
MAHSATLNSIPLVGLGDAQAVIGLVGVLALLYLAYRVVS